MIPTSSLPWPSSSFLHGQKAEQSQYHLAAAVYAYAFLFPEGTGQAPGRFDPRLRIAADLYNWALTENVRLGRMGRRSSSKAAGSSCPLGRSTWPSIPAPCALEIASCIG